MLKSTDEQWKDVQLPLENWTSWFKSMCCAVILFFIRKFFIFFLDSIKEYDTNRLNEEYQNMVQGLRQASAQRDADLVLANPILPDDILQGKASAKVTL